MAARSGCCRPSRARPSNCNSRPRKRAEKPSDPLDDDGRRHAAGNAHRHQPAPEITPLQFVEDGADQDRTGRTNGMTERDGAAVDVDLVAIELEITDELFGD